MASNGSPIRPVLDLRVIPYFQKTKISEWNHFPLARELRARLGSVDPALQPDLRILVTVLIHAYATDVEFHSSEQITKDFEHCTEVGVPEAIDTILKNLLGRCEKAHDYLLDTFFLPALPLIFQYAQKHDTIPQFSPLLLKIITCWTRVVLGQKPFGDISSFLSSMSQWGHKCQWHECLTVNQFLSDPKNKYLRLSRLSQQCKRHLEGLLSKHASTGATWSQYGPEEPELLVRFQ